MSKNNLCGTFVSVISLMLVISPLTILVVKADPFIHGGMVPPDTNTKPPTIQIQSPEDNATYKEDAINLSFSVNLGYSNTATAMFIREIYYETDWENETTYAYKSSSGKELENPFTLNLTDIPDGNHTIEITACEMGDYHEDLYIYTFMINGSSKADFEIKTISDQIENLDQTSFPMTGAIILIVIIVVGAGIIVYFKKYRK